MTLILVLFTNLWISWWCFWSWAELTRLSVVSCGLTRCSCYVMLRFLTCLGVGWLRAVGFLPHLIRQLASSSWFTWCTASQGLEKSQPSRPLESGAQNWPKVTCISFYWSVQDTRPTQGQGAGNRPFSWQRATKSTLQRGWVQGERSNWDSYCHNSIPKLPGHMKKWRKEKRK